MESDDPTVIRVLVVTADDVVAALEANERRDRAAVLRVTPPFSGRMRARLHVAGAESEYDKPAPLHISPKRLLDTVPPFPTPDETEDEIRTDSDLEYSPDLHRKRHEAALEGWREQVRAAIADETTVETVGGTHRVRISTLG